MCNLTGIAFGQAVLAPGSVAGRAVLEVGSMDVNGSLRPFVESLGPASYVGVDIAPGPSVDVVVDASGLVDRFGAESFDVVITTEMLEHIRDWQTVVSNLKRVVRPGGLLLVTTRSIGFPYHGYPYDFWRYEPEDMRAIFADFEIEALERDSDAPGIFMLARKPTTFAENRAALALYSIVAKGRKTSISTFDIIWFRLGRSIRSGASTATKQTARRLRRTPRTVRRCVMAPARRRIVAPVWRRIPPSMRSRVKRLLRRA